MLLAIRYYRLIASNFMEKNSKGQWYH